jgi:3-oxoacyl-(acyl-carrier-protein) synthase
MNRAVFVAGRGAVSGFGAGARTLLSAVFSGKTALRPRRRLADVACTASVVGEIPVAWSGADSAETDLPFRLGLAAAEETLAEAGCGGSKVELVVATTKADLSGITGPGHGLGSPYRLALRLHEVLGTRGAPTAISCACASGVSALALAGRRIRSGASDRVLVIGTDVVSAFILRGFDALLALDPGACRPFDRSRCGLSLGEAAAAVLLTSHHTESIGVELRGWGESNDANHITGPQRDGAGLRRAAAQALRQAGLAADAVDYVHLHGTGTPFNDAMEGRALQELFGGRGPVASGTKAQTGHTLGAAGVLECMIAMEALLSAHAPGNVGLDDPDVPLRLPTATEPLQRARCALKVAAGFGGINAALVLAR